MSMIEYLEDTFTLTCGGTGRSRYDVIEKYPFLAARTSMLRAITESGLAGDSQRNPNGYTAQEITEKVIEYWDQVISAWWPLTYDALVFQTVNSRWKMNQSEYWKDDNWSLIFHNGNTAGDAATILANTDVVILPGNYYPPENQKTYQQRTWLGFDNTMMRSNFAAEMTNTAGVIGGIKSGGLTDDDENNPIDNDNFRPSFLAIYDNVQWQPVLSPNGLYNSVPSDPDPTSWGDPLTDIRYTELARAHFDVTVVGGVVTSVVGVARPDGQGTPVTGGWNYDLGHDYSQIGVLGLVEDAATYSPPIILARTNADQSGYPGNSATSDITQADQEFWSGSGILDGVYTGVLGDNSGGWRGAAARDLSAKVYDNEYDIWYNRNWPVQVRPRDVRVTLERPVLTTTSRSQKQTRVSTGSHRMTFEYSYAPMRATHASRLIDAYELCHGAGLAMQIFIPKEVMQYQEMQFNDLYPLAPRTGIIQSPTGNAGSNEIVMDGFAPNYRMSTNGRGLYFLLGEGAKLHRIIDWEPADDYGRMLFKIEPPLLQDQNGYHIGLDVDYTIHPSPSPRLDYIPMKAYIVDDSFEVTVDSAGLYRVSVKFVEAMT